MTGREWAEEFLPIPADRHQLHQHPVNPGVDLIRARQLGRRIGDTILAVVGVSLVVGAFITLFGVTL